MVALEGVDGVGKSTQAALLAAGLREAGVRVVSVREPGGTALGEAVRGTLLGSEAHLEPWAEALLFMAARAQLIAEVITPALARGAVVVCDRYIDSTLAYQGAGRGLGIEPLSRLFDDAGAGLWPDLTVLLQLGPEAAEERRGSTGLPLDRMEVTISAVRDRVAAAFDAIARAEPGRIARLDAAGPVTEVAGAVRASVHERLGLPVFPPR